MSAPNLKGNRRSAIELATTVLDNYEAIDLTEPFFDLIPSPAPSLAVQHAILAKHAWTRSAPHAFFGDRLFAGLIRDPQKRAEITAYLGHQIVHEYINNRGRMELTLHDE